MVTTEEFLEHHGIKGQKWGIRNKRSPVKTTVDHRTVAEIRKKKTSQLTNKQLRAHNERLNLEMKFNQMNQSSIKKGQKTAKALLAGALTAKTVFELVNSPFGKAAIAAGKKKTGLSPGARAPKGFEKLLSKR